MSADGSLPCKRSSILVVWQWACSEEETPAAAAPAAPAAGEPLDLNGALALVLKKALSHDGLSRGLHEVVRSLEKGQAQLVVLAEDCNQPDYKKLVEALCAEQSANLLSVKEAQQLGTWAGVSAFVAGRIYCSRLSLQARAARPLYFCFFL